MIGKRSTALWGTRTSSAPGFPAGAFTAMAILLSAPPSGGDPLSIAVEGEDYFELSVGHRGENSPNLLISPDLENWEIYTIIPEDRLPTLIQLPVSAQSRFLRLDEGFGDISEYVDPTPSPQPRADRLLGWDILDETPDSDFGENYELTSEIGADFYSIHFTWSSLEPSDGGGSGRFVDPGQRLAAVGDFVATVRELTGKPFKVSLTLRPIDATGKTVPSDLWTRSFGSETDTRMADRFVRLLNDHVFKAIPPDYLTSLQIGNEIDQYDTSGEPESFWTEYGWFLFHVNQKLASAPETRDLPIGFTVTFPGIARSTEADRDPFIGLSSAVDVVGVTYYGNSETGWDIRALSSDAILADLRAFTESFPDRAVYLQELGFQTSPLNRSSETEQARFFRNFFAAWDAIQDRIPLVNIVRFNDYSLAVAETEAMPYQIDPRRSDYRNFVEYLRTLGIRTYGDAGRLKPAYDILKTEAKNRGWGSND